GRQGPRMLSIPIEPPPAHRPTGPGPPASAVGPTSFGPSPGGWTGSLREGPTTAPPPYAPSLAGGTSPLAPDTTPAADSYIGRARGASQAVGKRCRTIAASLRPASLAPSAGR